jgi:hypothetical protein
MKTSKRTSDERIPCEILETPVFRREVVPLAELLIDEYQREEKPHAKKILKNFDPAACTSLLIGVRADGKMYLVDGQQRRAALLKKGYTHWKADLFASCGKEHEAVIFNRVNGAEKSTKRPDTFEIFNAKLVAKDPAALDLVEAVKEGGLVLSLSKRNKYPNVTCIAKLESLYKKPGRKAIVAGLRALKRTWIRSDQAMRVHCVAACIRLVSQKNFDEDRFVEKLSPYSMCEIHQKHSMYGNDPAEGYHNFMVSMYNKGIRNSRMKLKKSEKKERLSEDTPELETVEIYDGE